MKGARFQDSMGKSFLLKGQKLSERDFFREIFFQKKFKFENENEKKDIDNSGKKNFK